MSSNLTEELSALSIRDEDVYSSIDATNKLALLDDVVKANGEEHLYDKIMELTVNAEEEPLLIFGWRNVEVFIQAIRVAQAQAAAPGGEPLLADPLALPAVVNVKNFKEAVFRYAGIQGPPALLGTTCLPCSGISQFGQVVCMLANLDYEPWIQRIIAVGGPNSLPIASVFVSRYRSNTLGNCMLQRPHSFWG